jgi:hypothetical protein
MVNTRRRADGRNSDHGVRRKHSVNNRIAAYMLAIDRVATPSSCGIYA